MFLTPRPVWAALLARGLSGGFAAAWPLAVAVVLGDLFWPIALSIDRLRRLLTSPSSLRRMNWTAGRLMMLVGCAISLL